VSHWLWLYFIVTVALSTIIILWWRITQRRKLHEIDDTFGAEGAERKSRD
jgi:hypothetical protein